MSEVYIVSNINPEKIEFIGIFASLLFCASIFYNGYGRYLHIVGRHKMCEVFEFCSRWCFRSSMLLWIMWSTFMIINQVNGWLEIMSWF